MMPILQVGPLSLPLPALIIIAGIWLGITFSERRASHYGVSANHLANLMLLALIAGLIGARLAYVARYPSAFYENPLDIFSRNPGLFEPIGGLAFGCIIAGIYAQRKKLPLWSTLDSLTPALAVLGIAIGFSHLASGNFFGLPTDLPWSITLWDAHRHPTQIYEIIFAAIILLIVWQGHYIFKFNKPGTVFLSFIALTAAAHLFIAAFRGDSILVATGIRRDQIIAWVILAITLWGLGKLWYTKIDTQLSNATPNESTNNENSN
jgi:phosphatidylglycerol:prolipoprotein diacylglycerol transferase